MTQITKWAVPNDIAAVLSDEALLQTALCDIAVAFARHIVKG
jgi:hypothetical protein